ncbi:iron donor protein CyaY [Terriglobus roseus]|uniref:CyaY protein n=1 Tax=Terriglobus roseus TaxID=392734 RepID=A0A1G7GGY0_9BACT|nr:iron donor protein CyaY [Terriglobus roseus]SDE87384.1 CyaY protein [Terriglobus roseus]
MVDEQTFRRDSDTALEQLKQRLIDGEDLGGYETEENNGVLNIIFDAPKAKFVFTPNTPVRQIWISALSTSFKLDWAEGKFVLPKTGEDLDVLTERLIKEHTDDDTFEL